MKAASRERRGRHTFRVEYSGLQRLLCGGRQTPTLLRQRHQLNSPYFRLGRKHTSVSSRASWEWLALIFRCPAQPEGRISAAGNLQQIQQVPALHSFAQKALRAPGCGWRRGGGGTSWFAQHRCGVARRVVSSLRCHSLFRGCAALLHSPCMYHGRQSLHKLRAAPIAPVKVGEAAPGMSWRTHCNRYSRCTDGALTRLRYHHCRPSFGLKLL